MIETYSDAFFGPEYYFCFPPAVFVGHARDRTEKTREGFSDYREAPRSAHRQATWRDTN